MMEVDPDRPEKTVLDAQEQHWQKTFVHKPEMFGGDPSGPAAWATDEAPGMTTTTQRSNGRHQPRAGSWHRPTRPNRGRWPRIGSLVVLPAT